MRTTALPSMLEVLTRNINFSNENVNLFEMANVYLPKDEENALPDEPKMIVLGAYGDTDFYTLKGVVENILASARIKGATYKAVSDNPSYHPGRCARVIDANGYCLGIFGQIHPLVCENYGVNIPVYVAELSFDKIFGASDMTIDYKPLPKFPATTRDFSFVCDEELTVGEIEAVMSRAAGKLCESVKLFDIYRGEKIGEGKKSVSFRVTLRASDRTLTVEEADKASSKILNDLKFKLGIGIRE